MPDEYTGAVAIQWIGNDRQAVLHEDGTVEIVKNHSIETTFKPTPELELADRFSVNWKDKAVAVESSDTLIASFPGGHRETFNIPVYAIALRLLQSGIVLVARDHIYSYKSLSPGATPENEIETAPANSASIDDKGQVVAELTEKGSVVIFDISQGGIKERCRVGGVPFLTNRIAFYGGDVFLAEDEFNVVRLLQVSRVCQLNEIVRLPGKGSVEWMSVAAGKAALVVEDLSMPINERRLEIVNLESGRHTVMAKPNQDYGPVAISPSGKTIAIILNPSTLEILAVEKR
ncbi:MAG TPA: hypothetical protein VKG86_12155 [Terracidiphilus sp.]|nr:hypothetical protein [Terracidiphilus sp.]